MLSGKDNLHQKLYPSSILNKNIILIEFFLHRVIATVYLNMSYLLISLIHSVSLFENKSSVGS